MLRSLSMLCVMAAALSSALLFTGCQRKNSLFNRQKEVIDRSELLCRGYLEGDLKYARRCLAENAELLEGATILEPVGRSQLLAKSYSRSYVLETRAGNHADAEVNLIKAKYWKVRNAELMGYNAAEITEDMKRDTADRVYQYIDGFDRKQNGGKAPNYVEKLGDLKATEQGASGKNSPVEVPAR